MLYLILEFFVSLRTLLQTLAYFLLFLLFTLQVTACLPILEDTPQPLNQSLGQLIVIRMHLFFNSPELFAELGL